MAKILTGWPADWPGVKGCEYQSVRHQGAGPPTERSLPVRVQELDLRDSLSNDAIHESPVPMMFPVCYPIQRSEGHDRTQFFYASHDAGASKTRGQRGKSSLRSDFYYEEMTDLAQAPTTDSLTPGSVARGIDREDEARLVAAVLLRDRKAMADFVSRYTDSVYGYVRHRMMPRTDLVDDLVQEVFLAALKGLDRFSGKAPLRSWLLGIARLRVADHYRRTLRRDEVFDETEDPEAGPTLFPAFDEQIDHERLKARTRRVLSDLPDPYAYVLVSRYWDKRSVREISTDTGRTEKAVERLLARARVQFKRRWETASD